MQRLEPKERKQSIMDAAITLAKTIGYAKIRRENVAQQAGVSAALVSRYWGTMTKLRRAVMREAIKRKELKIMAEGIAIKDKQCDKLPPELREEALKAIA